MTYGLGGNHPIVFMCCGAGSYLFAENSSPTQVSVRFTDQVQTGNAFSASKYVFSINRVVQHGNLFCQ